MNNDSKMTQEKPNSKLKVSINADTGFWKDKNFEHEFGNFTVITGVNGSGKTKLLEYIAKDADITSNTITRFIETTYKLPHEQYPNEMQSRTNYTLNVNNHNDQGIFLLKNMQGGDVEYRRENIRNNNITQSLDYQILLDTMKRREVFNDGDTDAREVELRNENEYKKVYDIKSFLPLNEQDDLPWDRIDRILAAFDLNIRIGRTNLGGKISFLRKFLQKDGTYEERQILTKDLSSGEQVAFAVALWTWGSATGQRSELLLVDEFDAHLNPSIAAKFIEVIQTYFVNEGVRVIMTTHSPSTVAYVSEENLFWMEQGKIQSSEEKDGGKIGILHTLATGVMIENGCPFMSYLVDRKKPYYILVEGYTDILHIQNACKKLGGAYKDIVKKCNFLHLNGVKDAKSVDTFIANFNGDHSKPICVIVDNDKMGNAYLKCLKSNALSNKNIWKNKSGNIFGIRCTIDEVNTDYAMQKKYGYIPIEFLYEKTCVTTFFGDDIKKTPWKDAQKSWKCEVIDRYTSADEISNYDDESIIILATTQDRKKQFTEHVQTLDESHFDGLKPTLDLVLKVIEKWEETNPQIK